MHLALPWPTGAARGAHGAWSAAERRLLRNWHGLGADMA